VLRWFATHARDLPWRATDPWGVLVSEVMLQQTPVARVLPVWTAWMERWPEPADLAAASQADAVRAWGRLGYPRRAQRLHAASRIITSQWDGQVPQETQALRALPGVGEYTAAAVQAFAFGIPAVVLDVNVRRVIARAYFGKAFPTAHITRAERELAQREGKDSAAWSAAMMELGALICTARSPSCESCPVKKQCAWRAQGYPMNAQPPRSQARYEGSDRQVRGAILAMLRENDSATHAQLMRGHDAAQCERALATLMDDQLIEYKNRRYSLTST